MKKHYVTFYSPGTLVAEETTRPIGEWNIPAAARMATQIMERHGATPYGFVFTTRLSADPVADGEGGTLLVQEREVERSGMHFRGGRLVTVDEVEARGDPKERILASNMRGNGYPIVVVNDNSWRWTQPFNEQDVIVDARGEIVERGDDPNRIAYRASQGEARGGEKAGERMIDDRFMEMAQAKVEADRMRGYAEHGGPVTLGTLVALLDALPPEASVTIDRGGTPGALMSYRGYYRDLAFAPDGTTATVAQVVSALRRARGATFEGYKGGEFRMSDYTLIWIAPYGESGGIYVVSGAVARDGAVVLTTAEEKVTT